jgi:hypothetical protein
VQALGQPFQWLQTQGGDNTLRTDDNRRIFETAKSLDVANPGAWQPQFVVPSTTQDTTPNEGAQPAIGTQPIVVADPKATANTRFLAESGNTGTKLTGSGSIVKADPKATDNTEYLGKAGGQVQNLTNGQVVTEGWGVNNDGTLKVNGKGKDTTQLNTLANQYNAVAPLAIKMNEEVYNIALKEAQTTYGNVEGYTPEQIAKHMLGIGPFDLGLAIKLQESKAAAAAKKFGVDTENVSGKPKPGEPQVPRRNYTRNDQNKDGKVDQADQDIWYENDQKALAGPFDKNHDYNDDGKKGDKADYDEYIRRRTSTSSTTPKPEPRDSTASPGTAPAPAPASTSSPRTSTAPPRSTAPSFELNKKPV